MSRKKKRRVLKPGYTTSYKLPVIKGKEGQKFYKWLNNFNSINGTITEALKLKFMLESMNMNANKKEYVSSNKASDDMIEFDTTNSEVMEVDEIDIFNDDLLSNSNDKSSINLESIKRTFNSVRR